MRLHLLPLLVLVAVLSAVEELPPLLVVPNDTLILRNGERPVGKIIEIRPDGTLIFTELGRTKPLPFAKDQYEGYEPSQDAAQAVTNRGRILIKRKDALGVKHCVTWGVANGAEAAALALALEAVTAFPADTAIGVQVLDLLDASGRQAEAEPIARALLQAQPRFERAYIALAAALRAQNRLDDLAKLTEEFLVGMPTSAPANRIKAELGESRDLLGAQKAFAKGWELHKDLDAALGYARVSLALGQAEATLRAATALIDAGRHASEARVYAGVARLLLDDVSAARTLLDEALTQADQLPQPLLVIARYDLGVARFRLGDVAGARDLWRGIDTPEARFALAILDRQPIETKAFTSPAMQALVVEHNACIALEAGQPDRALAGLTVSADEGRRKQLGDFAAVLRSGGNEETLRALAIVDGVEALRWRAYGLLLAKRFPECEKLLDQLPRDDGYAIVYRIYCAAAQKDQPRAKELFRTLGTASQAPIDYVAVLAAEYAADNDELVSDAFDWPAGDQLASGWQSQASETNIHVFAGAGQLHFDGVQTASPQPVTRAWRLAAADRLRQVEMAFITTKLGEAVGGLELLDSERRNGVAVGALAQRRLGFRTCRDGTWGEWQPLPVAQPAEGPLVIRIEIAAGRPQLVDPARQGQRHALGDAALPTTGHLAIAAFGVAEPNQAWQLAVDRLELQMKPLPRQR